MIRDTSKLIFFDKNPSFKSNSFFYHQEINTARITGSMKSEKVNLWDFYIPLEEISYQKNKIISFLIEIITKDKCSKYIGCREYDKITIPIKAYFSGFKDCIKIKL
jgi:hypothetical protein